MNDTVWQFWNERAELLRLIAHPVRLMILKLLSEKSRCVKDLNELFDISQPQLSQHMASLRNAELVGNHVNGPLRCYYIKKPTLVKEFIAILSIDHEIKIRDKDEVLLEMSDLKNLTKEKK